MLHSDKIAYHLLYESKKMTSSKNLILIFREMCEYFIPPVRYNPAAVHINRLDANYNPSRLFYEKETEDEHLQFIQLNLIPK